MLEPSIVPPELARRGVIGLLTAAAGVLLLGGCGLVNSNYTYRYRITVEVDTLEGLKTGFAVHEAIVGKSNVDLGELSAKRGMRTRGEAVAVDLPGGQTLFALMPNSRLTQSVLDPEWKNDWVESAMRITSGNTPKGPLPMTPGKPGPVGLETGYPMLVAFTDISDPASVMLVDPADLAASFGAGVRLKRITVQITDDPVTSRIVKRLEWLKSHRGSLDYSGKLHPENPEKDLTPASFLKE
jgi:hypothetical protein